MRKFPFSAPERQHEFIERVAQETGLPKAEVLRRIVDEYIRNYDSKSKGA